MTGILIGGASTQSRGRRPVIEDAECGITCSVDGVYERVLFSVGDAVVDDRQLLSWVVGQNGILWGATPPVELLKDAALIPGGSYGYIQEYELAEALGEVYKPLFAESGVRFAANGSDVCSMAVRLARAFTGKDDIATCGYHGHSDSLAHEPATLGVPKRIVDFHFRFEFGDVASMRAAANGAACVMVEVPAHDDEDYISSFLKECQKVCNETGILFILDEVVTGFRLGLRGAAGRYVVKPDLICLGKAMSAIGGISALIGRYDVMQMLEKDVFYSGTFFGEPGRCAVAKATIIYLSDNHHAVRGRLITIGKALKEGLNEVFKEKGISARVEGQVERSTLIFDEGEEARRAWCRKMLSAGVILDRPQFPTLVHTMDDVSKTIEAARRL